MAAKISTQGMVGVLVMVLQKNRTYWTHTYTEINYKELGHTSMEAW